MDAGIRFAKEVDLSRVDRNDRPMVRDVLIGIMTFESPMPILVVEVNDTPDHYNIIVKGWDQEMDYELGYNTFLNPKMRRSVYDCVISMSLRPTNDDNIPSLLFRIRKSSSAKHQKKRT
jgi:hypothetical protein